MRQSVVEVADWAVDWIPA